MNVICSWMMILALSCMGIPLASASNGPSASASKVAPDFKERTETLMNMVRARLDQSARGKNLSETQKHALMLQEAMILLGQLEFYIATFGIHDTYTTIKEINKFRPVVKAHVTGHLSGN